MIFRPSPRHRRSRRSQYGRLLHARNFRRLILAQVASEFGDFAGRIALAVLIVEETDSSIGAGLVLAVAALPYLGLGQYLTGLAAKFSPASILMGADLVRALAFAAIALDVPVAVRFLLLFVASTAAPVFESVRNGVTPLTVAPDQLSDAIGLQIVVNEVSRIFGLALGGAVAATISPSVALLANAGTFVFSAALVRRIDVPETGRSADRVRVGEGWAALVGDAVCRRTVILFAWLVAFGSVPEALVVPFVGEELPQHPALVGVFAALVSVAIIGTVPILRPPRAHSDRVRQTCTIAAVGMAAAAALFVLPSSPVSAALAFVCIGVPFAGRLIVGAAVSERLSDRVRASSFSVYDGVISMSQLVAGLGGGALAEWVGVRTSFVFALVVAASATAVLRLLPLQDNAEMATAA